MINFQCLTFFGMLGLLYAAYPECSYDVCANGGLWSEWTTTETCATSCGSCSKAFYTRKCLSANFPNCSCTGDYSRYILCNTQACAYPAQRTCCIPYIPMTINKTMACGPFPKDKSVSSEAPCCPKGGGLWSQWTGYAQYGTTDKTWKRTRKCLSEESGCPCSNPTTNVETSTNCPCKPMVNVKQYVTPPHDVFPMNIHINETLCTAYQEMEFFNDGNKKIVPCNSSPGYKFTALIRYVTPTAKNVYVEHRLIDCMAKGIKRVTFFCDLTTLNWRLDHDNAEIYGFGQVNIL